MLNEEQGPSDPIVWLSSTYFSSLSTMASTNVQYLNTTVAWALSLTTGAIAFILSRDAFPDAATLLVLSVLQVVLVHFFVRACKAYTSMMRFTTLEKMFLQYKIGQAKRVEIVEAIRKYHIGWRSPLPRTKIATKILFELGFLYHLMFIVGMYIWVLVSVDVPLAFVWVAAASIFVSVVELSYTFLRSPYFREPEVLALAKEQA